MKRFALSICIIIAAFLCAQTSFAAVINVNDNSLSDWGVTPGSDWDPLVNSNINKSIEPQGDSYFLNPGYGGHKFDVEAMYSYADSNNLYFAVVTGFPVGTTYANQRAGDLAIKFGNGNYAYGVETTGSSSRIKGGLYKVTSWGKGYNYWGSWGGHSGYYGGEYVGAPTEILATDNTWTPYTNSGLNLNYYGLQDNYHYVIEGYVPVSYFGSDWTGGNSFTLHWTETCGNDVGEVTGRVATPEPATMSLLGLGFLGLLGLKRKKR